MATTTKSGASESSGNGTVTKQSTDHKKKYIASDLAFAKVLKYNEAILLLHETLQRKRNVILI